VKEIKYIESISYVNIFNIDIAKWFRLMELLLFVKGNQDYPEK